jgi:hypothetical protein
VRKALPNDSRKPAQIVSSKHEENGQFGNHICTREKIRTQLGVLVSSNQRSISLSFCLTSMLSRRQLRRGFIYCGGRVTLLLASIPNVNFADGESLVSSISAGSTNTLSFKAWPLMLKRALPTPLLLGDGNTGHTHTWHVSDGYLEQDG